MPRYAQESIPEVWLIDVEKQVVTQYAHPLITGYRHQITLARGQSLVAQTIGRLEVAMLALNDNMRRFVMTRVLITGRAGGFGGALVP